MTSGSQLDLLPGAAVSAVSHSQGDPTPGGWGRRASAPVVRELPVVSLLLQKLLA